MKMRYVDLLKGLEFALNYHSIDAKVNMADFKLAELLGPQVIHGAECAKRGQDAAMTPMLKTTLAHLYDAPEPVDPGKPSDIEVIAERLAKVEDRLVTLNRVAPELNERIDKVAEIIGDRVTELVNDNNMILDSVKRAHERLDVHEIAFHYVYKALDQVMLRSGLGNMSSEYPLTPAFPNAPAFPTGGADTAEAATEAVLPVPQRGDRVRLEGLPNRETLRDGWYDVAGVTEWGVQIENGFDPYGTKRLYNVERSHVKEVRHAQS